MQRAGINCQRLGLPQSMQTVIAGAWLDAFLAGARFQERGGHQ